MSCGSGRSKSRLAKAVGAEPAGQMRDEKLRAIVARSTFSSQNCKRNNRFGACLEVEMSKVHVVAARSTFPGRNAQRITGFDNFLKFRCRNTCTLLWREA